MSIDLEYLEFFIELQDLGWKVQSVDDWNQIINVIPTVDNPRWRLKCSRLDDRKDRIPIKYSRYRIRAPRSEALLVTQNKYITEMAAASKLPEGVIRANQLITFSSERMKMFPEEQSYIRTIKLAADKIDLIVELTPFTDKECDELERKGFIWVAIRGYEGIRIIDYWHYDAFPGDIKEYDPTRVTEEEPESHQKQITNGEALDQYFQENPDDFKLYNILQMTDLNRLGLNQLLLSAINYKGEPESKPESITYKVRSDNWRTTNVYTVGWEFSVDAVREPLLSFLKGNMPMEDKSLSVVGRPEFDLNDYYDLTITLTPKVKE